MLFQKEGHTFPCLGCGAALPSLSRCLAENASQATHAQLCSGIWPLRQSANKTELLVSHPESFVSCSASPCKVASHITGGRATVGSICTIDHEPSVPSACVYCRDLCAGLLLVSLVGISVFALGSGDLQARHRWPKTGRETGTT